MPLQESLVSPSLGRADFDNPFGSPGIGVIRIDVVLGVNHSLVNSLQAVRFLADTFNEIDLYMPPLQQSRGLLFAGIARCVGAFRLGMKLVLGHNVTVGLTRAVGLVPQ